MRVNGRDVSVDADHAGMLATFLREVLSLTSVKLACERGECGSCTVLSNGSPVASCVLPVALAGEIETSEGVVEETRPLREALADLGGFQCGFCTPGQVMSSLAMLRAELPADDELARRYIRARLAGNICRCTGYTGIVEAVLRTARSQLSELSPREPAL